MPRLSLKDRLSSSNRIAIITFGAILMAFYAAVIADYFARPPSPGISREVEIARTEWLTSGTVRNHVLTLDSPDGPRATILFDDGHQTRIVDIDVYGRTVADETYPLDLTEARRISAWYRNSGRIALVGYDGSLFAVDIDRRSGEIIRSVLVPDAAGFLADGPALVLERPGGLYGLDGEAALSEVSGGSAPPVAGMPIVTGRVLDYAMDVAGDSIWIAAVVGATGSRYDLRLLRCTRDFQVVNDYLLRDDTTADLYRKVEGVYADGPLVDILTLWRDTKYGVNYLTASRVEEAGSIAAEYQTTVPSLTSEYTFVGSDRVSTSFIMRYRTVYGYNLIRCTLTADGAKIADLTKTRALSVQSAQVTIDGYDGIVFSDVSRQSRTILYASSNPEVVRRTTRWNLPIIGRALVVTLINSVMALFLGTVYLFFTSIIPFLVVGAVHRLLKRARLRNLFACVAGAVVLTGIKLAVTSFVINRTPNYRFPPPVVGNPPWIYVTLAAMSVASFVLVVRFLRPSAAKDHPVSGTFSQFLLADAVGYSLIFIIYAVTTLLITKL